MSDAPLREGLAEAVRDVAEALLPEVSSIAADIAERICQDVPEVSRAGVEDVVLSTCEANTVILLDYLRRDVPLGSFVPSEEVLQLTRTVVHRGLPLNATMRGYRVGAKRLIELWADAVVLHGPNDRTAAEIVKAGSTYALNILESFLQYLADEYHAEAERLAREQSLARVEEVRRVLTAADRDAEAAAARLGYRIAGRHIGVALRDCTQEATAGAALDAAVQQISRAMQATHHLSVRVDMRTVWCWMQCPSTAPQRVAPPTSPLLAAVGRASTGLSGFRNTHMEALDALRVAEIARREPPTITFYDDVDVAAMCSNDVEKCRDFIRTELGALTAMDAATSRDRETLIAYYAANSNLRAAAEVLGIHHNTVRYRLNQAQRTLGRPLPERRLPLELALHLHSIIGNPTDAL